MTREEELAAQEEFMRSKGTVCEPTPNWLKSKKATKFEDVIVAAALYRRKGIKPIMAPPKEISGEYGRVYLPKHPKSDRNGHVLEHRLVAEYHYGRFNNLDYRSNDAHVVHHINGNKSDNRPKNLAVITRKQHFDIHAMMEVTFSRKFSKKMLKTSKSTRSR